MKNVIFQYWNGEMNNCAKASYENISKYCKRIGVEHRFDHNANWSKVNSYYDAFRPIQDAEFEQYDNVVYMDMDIFAMDSLKDNIFDNDVKDVGICEEVSQPYLRATTTVGGGINGANDERWAIACTKFSPTFKQPRDYQHRLKVFNSGVVYYTAKGRENCRKHFKPFSDYVDAMRGLPRFYTLDQNYLNCVLFDGTIDTTILSNRWNAQIHYAGPERRVNDERKGRDCLVHLQLSGSGDYDQTRCENIINNEI